jgi:hypothetical protein
VACRERFAVPPAVIAGRAVQLAARGRVKELPVRTSSSARRPCHDGSSIPRDTAPKAAPFEQRCLITRDLRRRDPRSANTRRPARRLARPLSRALQNSGPSCKTGLVIGGDWVVGDVSLELSTQG